MLNDILELVNDSIQYHVLRYEADIIDFCSRTEYINEQFIKAVCGLYGYPITIIRQLQYTDKMYRDAYYIYLSHLHFDIGRHCQRLALFKGKLPFENFFDDDFHDDLQESFLGTIVIRPSYNHSAEYTIGRTLLNPYKMKYPLHYIRTAKYKAAICGQKYIVDAFPFSNQHGDVLRCAETSVWALMEYYGTRYENYRTVLPSTILNWASKELPERSLPSDGLTYSQISSILKNFNFEPRIYAREAYNKVQTDKDILLNTEIDASQPGDVNQIVQEVSLISTAERAAEKYAAEIDRNIKNNFLKEQAEIIRKVRELGEYRQITLHNLFHYYVESGIPLITAVCNTREGIHHSIVVIGHDERSIELLTKAEIRKNEFQYGDLNIIDSSSLYERYITIDDNQYPYRSEKFDKFSIAQNCIVKAFIVPLYRHILLDAEAAVNIIETVYRDSCMLIKSSLEQLYEENKQCLELPGNSIDNPVILRYYLTTSRGFVTFRNKDTEYLEEKLFYSTTAFPKFVWVGEYSTLELYCKGKILGEVVVDATAPKYSGMGAIISLRFGGRCASRQTSEPPEILREKLQSLKQQQARLLYSLYTNNLQKGDFVKC